MKKQIKISDGQLREFASRHQLPHEFGATAREPYLAFTADDRADDSQWPVIDGRVDLQSRPMPSCASVKLVQ